MKNHQTKTLGAVLVASLALITGAYAQVTVTGTTQTTAFTINTTNDLLFNNVASHVDTYNGATVSDTSSYFTFHDGTDTGTPGGVAALTDGTFGTIPAASGNIQNAGDFAGIQGGGSPLQSITYNFNTSVNTLGYDLSEVDIYSAWNNNGRSQINANVYYSTVAAPTVFTLLSNVSYTGGGTTPVANEASLTNGTIPFLATQVASVEFTFPAQENNGVGYRELSVIGTAEAVPEPSTWAMLLSGVLLMLGVQRFSRKNSAV